MISEQGQERSRTKFIKIQKLLHSYMVYQNRTKKKKVRLECNNFFLT